MDRNNSIPGWAAFAGYLLAIVGVLHGISGFVALLKPNYYLVGEENLLAFSYTTWGWVHLLGGLLLLWTGVSLLNGANWARLVAIVLASFALIVNLLFITTYPFWSIFAIVVDMLIIYGLTVRWEESA